MELDSNGVMAGEEKGQVLPEVEMYSYLLAQLFLISSNNIQKAKIVSDEAFERLGSYNRRTLDAVGAKIYFYYGFVHEKLDQLKEIRL